MQAKGWRIRVPTHLSSCSWPCCSSLVKSCPLEAAFLIAVVQLRSSQNNELGEGHNLQTKVGYRFIKKRTQCIADPSILYDQKDPQASYLFSLFAPRATFLNLEKFVEKTSKHIICCNRLFVQETWVILLVT